MRVVQLERRIVLTLEIILQPRIHLHLLVQANQVGELWQNARELLEPEPGFVLVEHFPQVEIGQRDGVGSREPRPVVRHERIEFCVMRSYRAVGVIGRDDVKPAVKHANAGIAQIHGLGYDLVDAGALRLGASGKPKLAPQIVQARVGLNDRNARVPVQHVGQVHHWVGLSQKRGLEVKPGALVVRPRGAACVVAGVAHVEPVSELREETHHSERRAEPAHLPVRDGQRGRRRRWAQR